MATVHLGIGGMSCSFCADTLRQAVRRLPGVEEVSVSLAHEEALVRYDPARVTEAQIADAIRSVGYTVRDPARARAYEDEEADLRRERDRLLVAAAFTWMTGVLMVLMWVGRPLPAARWLMPALAAGTVFGPGLAILKMAGASLRRGILNQHVLLELAAFAGLAGGALGFARPDFPSADFFAVATFVTTYHILSGYASLLVRTRASQAVRRLLALQPPTARVVRDGREEEVPVEQVRPGDLVRVRPGEAVPVDGEVVEGASAVDESLVTGEPLPRDTGPGDEVIGGSVNTWGTLVVRVTRVGDESFLHQVARSVAEARALKPGIVQLVDRVLRWYVPAVLAVAGLSAVLWTAGAWLVTGQPSWARGVFAALAVLVMGYPCALGMATPLAMIRGGGEAARRGILMRSAQAFQALPEVTTVVLDKTGTVTVGRPQVTDVVALGADEREVLRLAASAEAPSEHPLARAIVERARSAGVEPAPVRDFAAVAGRGVRAVVEGVPVRVGSLRFLREDGAGGPLPEALLRSWEEAGRTVVGVAAGGRIVGVIALGDRIKDDASDAVSRLKQLGIRPVMVTGDSARAARAVAEAVGIEEVRAQVLPQDKAAHVRALQARGHRVAMVGDGINDAPALMQADVGIAIGAGTDIAIESSDVVLVGDRLGAVVDAYHIARTTYRKTVHNLALAFSFNGVGVPAAATGLVHPVWAMAAMVASVSAVLLNSFGGRLLPRPRAAGPETREIVLTVPSMHCDRCADTVRRTLSGLAGVLAVRSDLPTRRVAVVVRGGVRSEDLCAALGRIGHVCGDA